MQTFLPVADYEESAKILDYKRLGKQRVETMQIYNAIGNPAAAWRNHPMVRMWSDTPASLLYYGWVMCEEWSNRGYNDNMIDWFSYELENKYSHLHSISKPSWFGDEKFHSSHRAALLWKHLSYYQRFGWTETPKLDYYWPV